MPTRLRVYVSSCCLSVAHGAQQFVVVAGTLHAVFDEFHGFDTVAVAKGLHELTILAHLLPARFSAEAWMPTHSKSLNASLARPAT